MGTVQALSTYLSQHSVNVCWQLSSDLPEIEADRARLGQVVRNIVMNAAQSMPEGGDLTIGAEWDAVQSRLSLHFQDTGVGIVAHEAERIFRPFFTTKVKGTGLGLPIVRKIVRLHGGSVDVVSEPGRGARFIVTLPLRPARHEPEITIEPPVVSPWPTTERFPDPFSER